MAYWHTQYGSIVPGQIGYKAHIQTLDDTYLAPHSVRAGSMDLPILCPPDRNNVDSGTLFGDLPCENAFAPKCSGSACGQISVHQQGNEFYVSRVWAHGGKGNYTVNENADIYFPYDGVLSVVVMDIGMGDTLRVKWRQDDYNLALHTTEMGPIAVQTGVFQNRFMRWISDSSKTGHGWTLLFTPTLPRMKIADAEMPNAATGVMIHSVYNERPR